MRHNLNKCVISELSGSSERAKIHSRTPAGESAEGLARSVNESRRGNFGGVRRPAPRSREAARRKGYWLDRGLGDNFKIVQDRCPGRVLAGGPGDQGHAQSPRRRSGAPQ